MIKLSQKLPSRAVPARRVQPVFFICLFLWSILLGLGISRGLNAAQISGAINERTNVTIGTVDPVPERYQLGMKLYLENCNTCHVALPPEVMPSETWRTLLLESNQHYGKQLKPIERPFISFVWNYLLAFSRSLNNNEPKPFRVSESRYFKILHPQVKLPKPLNPSSCIACHPGAANYDYRKLTPDWENAP
ncbi:MAG TPA: cytochrome C [Cyanobacteria bacterium UBA11149]|nr:cytochrome C [Cyanobacteria bacterium UBA11367]HBE56382.1 cytochrome C [Cyanobacteria bacterium UBA11366]HBK66786.1 cytochrome C [Cyanobacteria bacterium UBA11166]HBR72697.1 cytochrome C [Cyanobacteria bacterium UBA11159]HBS71234.1 cytochrome C [Cyanobacteria bacterium UBA11153]HBW88201.1 cytochrome C [Cyanobacteria bacterium UBA11149]HCA96980.1 cytochrome C [Cyanobacteria bacterium UBA9226]